MRQATDVPGRLRVGSSTSRNGLEIGVSELIRRVEAVLDAHPDTRGRSMLDLPQNTDTLIFEPAG
jgi:hypothetical protein